MMEILVTGAAGFVGSHLSERLLAEGHAVRGMDCFSDYYDPARKEENARVVEEAGATFWRQDLAAGSLAEALGGVDLVFHLAAQPGISRHVPYATYVRNNLDATFQLLEAAAEMPRPPWIVNVATSSVYGKHATDSEEVPPKPTSYYGVTKLAAEQLVLSYQREGKLPACSLRLFSVYGPRERPEKLYPRLIEAMLRDEEFPLYEGSREHRRSFTYIGDIVDGFLAVLSRIEVCNGEIFNIGSDIEISTGEGMAIVEALLGRKARIKTVPRRPGDQLRTCANIDKARRLLGYAPRTVPREGLAAEVAWFQKRLGVGSD